jgi:transcriptional regulator with PAS, ATPase and Fis domain
MNKLAIVAYTQKAAAAYTAAMRGIFKNALDIEAYSVTEGIDSTLMTADLVVLSARDIYKIVQKQLTKQHRIIIANLVMTRNGFEQLRTFAPIGKAILVNTNLNLCMNCIDQIYQMMPEGIELYPYTPYMEIPKDICTAITPGESMIIPTSVEKAIDIGDRVIDISTVVYIMNHFGLQRYYANPETLAYIASIVPINFTNRLSIVEEHFNLFDFLDMDHNVGFLSFSLDGVVIDCNQTALRILKRSSKEIIGEALLKLFSQKFIRRAIVELKPLQKKVVEINGQKIAVKMTVDQKMSKRIGFMTLEIIGESEPKQWAVGRGYTAKHTFDDIFTKSPVMESVIQLAQKHAARESSILIIGESGTGKELFAQAIHNASDRSVMPFVAINCASLPETLLESELFGYEEGAFTGALRGGKRGIFELANNGTLFLDEIGEMPIHLQSRLLRVLEEKEIMRIGGESMISVDVRVIAATNRDFADMIKKKKFRLDLFYRLCVIPVKLVPLRSRTEDIPLLIEAFKKYFDANFDIAPGAMKRLQLHTWPGNVRELKNQVEYLRNVQKNVIEASDIHFIFNEVLEAQSDRDWEETAATASAVDVNCSPETIPDFFEKKVLETIYNANMRGVAVGRRSLSECEALEAIGMTESRIRHYLKYFEREGLIEVSRGRRGTQITAAGIEKLNQQK